jgi:signal transduction histidine kinase
MVDLLAAAFAACIVILLGVGVAQARRARLIVEEREAALRRAAELARKLREAEDALSSAQSTAVEKEQLAAVGELSAMIAHEIRNPLTIIGNAVTTLRRKDVAPEDRATLLGILTEESERLNRLVGDLLSYARPVPLDLQRVCLRDVVERALSLVKERPDLEVELVEPVPVGNVMADPNLLRQVFENLVNNAAQAMLEEGGILTVRIARGGEPGTPGVDIVVEDTGEGMDTSVRDRALMPFFTTRPNGTGLGLAIVARLVRAHGGKLEIKSAAGHGTSVRVFLPNEVPGSGVAQSHRRLKQPPAA